MKITAIKQQAHDLNRVNVSIDGKYRLSLDLSQVIDLGIKVGKELDETDLARLEDESQFGKLYTRALEYCLLRPRSEREMRDYLWRKTLSSRTKDGRIKPGVSKDIVNRVLEKLVEKNYLNDKRFAEWWVENRYQKKGISHKKLIVELKSKGISSEIIEQTLEASTRDDLLELQKIINKKAKRYDDERKLIQYLVGQGFRYDDIKVALEQN
jgi:regulatory protein